MLFGFHIGDRRLNLISSDCYFLALALQLYFPRLGLFRRVFHVYSLRCSFTRASPFHRRPVRANTFDDRAGAEPGSCPRRPGCPCGCWRVTCSVAALPMTCLTTPPTPHQTDLVSPVPAWHGPRFLAPAPSFSAQFRDTFPGSSDWKTLLFQAPSNVSSTVRTSLLVISVVTPAMGATLSCRVTAS